MFENIASIDVVCQNAGAAGMFGGDLQDGCADQHLQGRQARRVSLALGRQLLQLQAMIESQSHHLRPGPTARRYTVQVIEAIIQVRAGNIGSTVQIVIKLNACRYRRCAAMPRDHQCTAGIGITTAIFQRLVLQPAPQEAGQKAVAGAQHIQDVDGDAFHRDAGIERCADRSGKNAAAIGTALDDKGCAGQCAQIPKGSDDVVGAAGDADLFLGADDQVAERHDLLQVLADAFSGDIADLALAVPGQSP